MEEVEGRDIVFDLDGTLLIGDLGETIFYEYLLDSCLQAAPLSEKSRGRKRLELRGKAAETLLQYLHLIDRGQCGQAYQLVAKTLSGISLHNLKRCVQGIVEVDKAPAAFELLIHAGSQSEVHATINIGVKLRSGMDGLVSDFKSAGAEIWIVSASPQNVVEILGDWFELGRNRILAVTTSDDGSEVIRFPWRQKKVDALRDVGVTEPILAFGDSFDDAEMLEMADFAVVMADGDSKLISRAMRENWLIFP